MDPLELLKKKLGLPPSFKLSENAESKTQTKLRRSQRGYKQSFVDN